MEHAMQRKFKEICLCYDRDNKGHLTTDEARSLIRDFFRFFPVARKHQHNESKMKLMTKNIFDIVTEFNKNVKKVQISLVIKIFVLLCKKYDTLIK